MQGLVTTGAQGLAAMMAWGQAMVVAQGLVMTGAQGLVATGTQGQEEGEEEEEEADAGEEEDLPTGAQGPVEAAKVAMGTMEETTPMATMGMKGPEEGRVKRWPFPLEMLAGCKMPVVDAFTISICAKRPSCYCSLRLRRLSCT